MKKCFKKFVVPLVLISVLSSLLVSCGNSANVSTDSIDSSSSSNQLFVYNWGEYIDPEVITMFEEETGIKVVYDMFETNEEMYPIVEKGARNFDVICPSEYMIEKMINAGLLLNLDMSKIPNFKNIDPKFIDIMKQVSEDDYFVPYMTGTVGILYNKTILDEKGLPYPRRWADLFDGRYKDEILMQNSVRDALMVALKKNGYSMNTSNEDEIRIATEDLISQKPDVQAYVVDQVRDKMISGEAAIGVIYSGEVIYIQNEAEATGYEYGYVLPEEGTNVWLDGWVITKNSKNKENAYKWLDFMCRADVAKLNSEFITYESPNAEALLLISDEAKLDSSKVYDYTNNNKEIYKYLGDELDQLYNDYWKKVKSE